MHYLGQSRAGDQMKQQADKHFRNILNQSMGSGRSECRRYSNQKHKHTRTLYLHGSSNVSTSLSLEFFTLVEKVQRIKAANKPSYLRAAQGLAR